MNADGNMPDIVFDKVNVAICSLCGCDIDVSGIEPFLKVECPDCGSIETVPGKLGPFLLMKLLGTGGMGGVYMAKDTALGRFVGIKVMLSSVGEDLEFIETFKREAQAAAKLNHPNIAQIYSFGQEKGQPYIVMELVSGKHFDEMVDEEKSLDQGLIMKVGLDIALGLQVADEIGLIHGDIKPENILLDEKMNAKLVDFGIASFAHQGKQEGIWGTPYYICPEKIRKQKVDARSDIYSLGATLYHAITKHPPFEGDTPIEVVKARLKAPPTPMSKYRRNVNPRVDQIISRMLQLEPARRYPNYSSLISDLQKAVSELGSNPRSVLSKKGRKVVISKRSTSEQTPASGKNTAVKTKRTIVPPPSERRPAIKTTMSATASAAAIDESHSAIAKYKTQGNLAVEPEKKGKGGLIAFLIILFLLLAGAGIGTFLVFKDKKEKAQQALMERTALIEQKRLGEVSYAQIGTIASNITVIAASAADIKSSAEAAVLAVLGEPLVIEPPKAEPPKAEPPKAKTEQAPNTEAGLSASGMPEGMPTREQLDAMRAKQSAAPPPPPEEEEKMQVEPEPPAEEPPVKILARQILAIAAEIQKNSEAAQQTLILSLGNKSKVDASRTSYEAAANLKILNSDLEAVKTLETDSRERLQSAQKTILEADEIKKQKEADEEAKLKAIQEEEARVKAEIDARRKAEAYAELVKNELELAESSRKINESLIRQHLFKEAINAIKAQTGDFKSEEGKQAILIVQERFERLEALRQFLIENIKKDPYKWGYGSGRSARDIGSADEKGIQVMGLPQTITWESLGAKQMLQIINHYLASKSIRIRALGEANLAAAIYCYEIGQGNDAAINAAKKYVETAVSHCDDLQARADKLLQF